MACIEQSILINAPITTVFSFVVAEWQGTLGFWRHGIRKWRPLSAQPLGVGFRVRYTAQVLGVPFPMEMEIIEFQPERGWVAKSVRGPRAEGRWEFAALGAGTLFTYRLTYDMPPPWLGPRLDRWFFAPAWRRAIVAALENLRRNLQSEEFRR